MASTTSAVPNTTHPQRGTYVPAVAQQAGWGQMTHS
jgi:hypothetical protein